VLDDTVAWLVCGVPFEPERYVCLADVDFGVPALVDTFYNVYALLDPIAYTMNATVDAEYANRIKPVAIPSQTSSLLGTLGDSISRVSKLFDSLPSFPTFGSTSSSETGKDNNAPPLTPGPVAGVVELNPTQFSKMNRAEKR
jgi:hypothetical protein